MVAKRLYFTGVVDDENVGKARNEIFEIMDSYEDDEIKPDIILDINSPGGSMFAGLDLFGVIREASDAGHKVITRISGYGASMAGVLLQAGDVRQIRADSYLHLHEAGSGNQGKASDMRDTADLLDRLTLQIAKIYARRSTLSAEAIMYRVQRAEWWLEPAEALELGFVDEIV